MLEISEAVRDRIARICRWQEHGTLKSNQIDFITACFTFWPPCRWVAVCGRTIGLDEQHRWAQCSGNRQIKDKKVPDGKFYGSKDECWPVTKDMNSVGKKIVVIDSKRAKATGPGHRSKASTVKVDAGSHKGNGDDFRASTDESGKKERTGKRKSKRGGPKVNERPEDGASH